MHTPDAALRRVSVRWGSTALDVSLPAELTVAELIPSILDLLGDEHLEARRLEVSPPGAAPLDPSTTLAQNRIDDGAVLVLHRPTPAAAPPCHLDAAEAVSSALGAAPGRALPRSPSAAAAAAAAMATAGGAGLIRHSLGGNAVRDAGGTVAALTSAAVVGIGLAAVAHRGRRDPAAGLGYGLLATASGAVAGFAAVPGGTAGGHVLLGAAAAAVTAVVALRVSGCGATTLTAVACAAVLAAVAALAGVISGAPARVVGSAATLVSVVLLAAAARVAIALTGLSARLTPDGARATALSARAIRADGVLTSLYAGLCASAAIGAVVTAVAGAPRPSCFAFGTVTGAALLLRARGAPAGLSLILSTAGIVSAATTFGAMALLAPIPGPWIAGATVTSAAAALHLRVNAPAMACSPVVRRTVESLECVALVSLVPLTGWICGVYAAARGAPPW